MMVRLGTLSLLSLLTTQCYVQIPLIVALASRNNLISYLTGISYQKLNFMHRAAGRACYIFAWVHTIAYCVVG
jgi:hypothetical protein